MKSIIGVYGMSGFGREVIPLVREQLGGGKAEATTLVFIDDGKQAESANGHGILSYEEFLAFPAEQRVAAIAITDGGIRKKLSEKLRGDGVRPLAVRAANVVVMDEVEIGEGAILCPFVTLTSNIVIGTLMLCFSSQ
jgi:acetyltransferase-like isoleucine patch superfamily enzyme